MRRLATLALLGPLLGGCAFIQGWGDLRDGEGGMDGGATDGGLTDAGTSDAGVVERDAGDRTDAATDCNDCALEGCGVASPECQYDPMIDCFVCLGGGEEGEDCVDDFGCGPGLICELGRCLYDCTIDDCSVSALPNVLCGVPDTGPDRRVCVGQECDPTAGACGTDRACAIVPDRNGGGDAGTVYALATVPIGIGQPCMLNNRDDPFNRCSDGNTCVQTGMGPRCLPVCLEGSTGCMAATACVPLEAPAGGNPQYMGAILGVCRPEPTGCVNNMDCTIAGRGDYCLGGVCSRCDPSDSMTCAFDCRDPDGDGSFDCLAFSDCAGAMDCGGPPNVCREGLCMRGCVDTTVCVPEGWDECRTHRAGGQVCMSACPPGGMCTDGTPCADYDGDFGNGLECRERS